MEMLMSCHCNYVVYKICEKIYKKEQEKYYNNAFQSK